MAKETSPSSRKRRRVLVAALAILAATLLTFGRIVRYDFLASWDDDTNVTANPHLVAPDAVRWFWAHPYAGMYVPVSYTCWALEAKSSGAELDARIFRVGSIGLHALAAFLAFLVLRRVIDADWPALAGALLFALHPLQVEAVAWISETRGLLAAVFGLAALCVHLSERSLVRRGLALLFLALALLSKPSAVAVPLIALVLDVAVLRRGWRASALSLLPWFVLVLAAGFVAKRFQPDSGLATVPTFFERPWIASDALAFYFAKLAWPLGLVPDHGRTPAFVTSQGAWRAVCGVIVLAVLLALRRTRTSTLVFVAGLAPVLGFVSFVHQDISTVASRFAYLAMLGPALALALALVSHHTHALWARALFAIALVACGALSFRQAGYWRDLRTLFAHNVEVRPDSAIAHRLLGLALENDGELDAAAAQYREALRLAPDHPKGHFNLGSVLARQGRTDEAREQFRAVLALDPHYASAHDALVQLDMAEHRWAQAAEQLDAWLSFQPGNEEARRKLDRVRAKLAETGNSR